MSAVVLQKTGNASWNGNGLGYSTASWAVKGSEHIVVLKLGTIWAAIDTASDNKKITTAFDKKTLLLKLASKL
ncbi:MAG: hypothetical protein ACO23H_10895 [Alphaproteobacteria bacterium]